MHHPVTRTRIAPVALACLLAGIGAACRTKTPGPLPTIEPPAETYEAMVSAYYGGVAALQVGDTTSRAKDLLLKATELIPEEPAAWADLGLYYLRGRLLEDAAAAIAKARELAPTDARVALLASLLEDQRGQPEAAAAILREALALDPGHLRARYALVDALRREGAEDSVIAAELDAVLKVSPQNAAATLDRARLAAKMGDLPTVRGLIDALDPMAQDASPKVQEQMAQVHTALDGDGKTLFVDLSVLHNILLAEPAYLAALRELQIPVTQIGDPIGAFIRLPEPKSEPAAADVGLTFRRESHDGGADVARALPLGEEGASVPAFVTADMALFPGHPNLEVALPAIVDPETGDRQPAGVVALDLDNDRQMDLVGFGAAGLRMHRRSGEGFEPAEGATGLGAATLGAAYKGAWPVDIELDGDMDVVLARGEGESVALRNNGDGTWQVGDPLEIEGPKDLVWADWDSDGDADIAVADSGGLAILDNLRSGRYARLDLGPAENLSKLAAVDMDRDGWLDLIALDEAGAVSVRRADPGRSTAGSPALSALESIDAGFPTNGCDHMAWGDMDNSGTMDLVLGCVDKTRIALQEPDGSWAALPEEADFAAEAVADLDGDGRLDMVGLSGGPNQLAQSAINQGGPKAYHYQLIRPRGLDIPAPPPGQQQAPDSGDQRINSFGLGGSVSLRSGLLAQTQLTAGPVLHFGLGEHTGADVAHIYWPNGLPQGEFDLKGDGAVVVEQRLKGSCPWLFADNGTTMAFVTDILWKSPLGLRINAVDTAGVVQTEDWVNVRGDQLVAKDGFYDLRITAELWETHFFDMVSLMVVDHPADTQVRVDERFSIPPPPLAVQTTGPLYPLASAIDQDGRDVTTSVAERDETFLDTFDLGRYQGIAQDHWVELDLSDAIDRLRADAPDATSLALVAQGWIYPTDSSINVAIGQGKVAAPRDLSIEVPDGQGRWTEARARQGFPAGKRKTLVIDLAGLDPAGAPAPSKLRLRTNMEVYWDQLALTEVVQPAEPILQRRLGAESAELTFRGISITSHTDAQPAPRTMPEIPDYDRVVARSPWLDLGGFYTRFGDVKPLLETVDDRYVILNAGDEIRLRFRAPADPPAGWSRDFVFISDGWEKDGDFNTAYGETVLPLPAHDKPEYADPVRSGAVGSLEDDPVYQAHPQDWLDYHTRFIPPQRLERSLHARPRP